MTASTLTWFAQWALSTIASSVLAFATFVFLLPKQILERKIGLHFDERLAEFKSRQDEKIEGLKEQLAFLGDRGKLSNLREYEAITVTWNAFVAAHLATGRCIANFIQHPDLDRLSNEELEVYLDADKISEIQKQRIRGADNKNRRYSDAVHLRSIAEAQRLIFDARMDLRKNALFITPELRALFEQKLDAFSQAQAEQSINFDFYSDGQHAPSRDAGIAFFENSTIDFEEVLTAARARTLRQ